MFMLQENETQYSKYISLIRTLLLQSFVTAQKIIKKSTLVNNTSTITHEILSIEVKEKKKKRKNNIFKEIFSKLRISNESTFQNVYFETGMWKHFYNIRNMDGFRDIFFVFHRRFEQILVH